MRKEAERVLENVLFDIWHIDMRLNAELRGEKLLGDKINMSARDLVVLLYAIEEKLDINIKREDIVIGKFDTFDHIIELMCYALQYT